MGERRTALEAVERGSGGTPLVLLHGFALGGACWNPVLERLGGGRRILAYDLPGHGRSADAGWDRGTGGAAELLLADLARRGVETAHLAGHSLGGAVACVAALKKPALAASLTLLAPGGFGREINARLIRRFAEADRRETLLPLLEQFYGEGAQISEALIASLLEDRARPGAGSMYRRICEQFLDGDRQGELDPKAIAALGVPVRVIWGTQDRVTPTRQAHKLPGRIAVHVFHPVGHSLLDEIPDEIAAILGEVLETRR